MLVTILGMVKQTPHLLPTQTLNGTLSRLLSKCASQENAYPEASVSEELGEHPNKVLAALRQLGRLHSIRSGEQKGRIWATNESHDLP